MPEIPSLALEEVPSSQVRLHPISKHHQQRRFEESTAKRKVCKVGLRDGKTTGVARLAVKRFSKGHRVLYAAPATEQINRFWTIVSWSLAAPVAAGALYKNETQHYIELSGTQQRIKPKTLAATPYSADFIQQRQGFDTVKRPPTAAIEHDFEHKFKANVRKRTTDSEWDIGVEGANPKWLALSRILNGIMNEKNMARTGGKGDGPRRNT